MIETYSRRLPLPSGPVSIGLPGGRIAGSEEAQVTCAWAAELEALGVTWW
jgi:hypothetical protein